MTVDEVKELLKNLRSKKRRLMALQEYIASERSLLLTVSNLDNSSTPVKTSQVNGVEKRYVSHIDRIRKWEMIYDDLFTEMCKDEDKLASAMQNLSPTEYEVILNRYLLGLSRKKAADLMNYTEDGIKSATYRAIKKMTKK